MQDLENEGLFKKIMDCKRRYVNDNSACKSLSTLSQKNATVAEFGDCHRCLTVFCNSRTFLRQRGQGLSDQRSERVSQDTTGRQENTQLTGYDTAEQHT